MLDNRNCARVRFHCFHKCQRRAGVRPRGTVQLCPGIESQTIAGRSRPPVKIGLLWKERSQHGFLLNNPAAAGITLTEAGNSKVWQATNDLSESADPARLRHVYSTYNSRYAYGDFQGVAVKFGPADLSDSSAARPDLPLTLQFNVPVSAGMLNPGNHGKYSWLIVLYHDIANPCETTFAPVISSIVPAVAPGELQLFPKYGSAGSTITVIGNGLPAWAPVRVVKLGLFIGPSFQSYPPVANPVATTDASGSFEFELIIPGLDVGPIPIEVQVDGKTASAEFTVIESGVSGPSLIYAEGVLANLGDNFTRAFHYNTDTGQWTFYDPRVPNESGLRFFVSGELYWILVKEPAEVILNYRTRNLTCTPEGNCWNQIIW